MYVLVWNGLSTGTRAAAILSPAVRVYALSTTRIPNSPNSPPLIYCPFRLCILRVTITTNHERNQQPSFFVCTAGYYNLTVFRERHSHIGKEC